MQEAEDSSRDTTLQDLTQQQVADANRAARAAADALMLTDAPLLFPPGQLALAAMRSGFNKVCGNPIQFSMVLHSTLAACSESVPRSLYLAASLTSQ